MTKRLLAVLLRTLISATRSQYSGSARSIGVGKGGPLPALRTVRAVLPHTALQSLVSSSGVSRLQIGRVKGEQPMSREERVGPTLVISAAASDAGALGLLAQDGAQATAHEAVEDAEQRRGGMLEVAKPTPKHRVEVGDDPHQAVAPTAAGLRPHLVLERRQALLADQAAAGLEPIAQELEAMSRLSAVADPRFVRMERQAVGHHPG